MPHKHAPKVDVHQFEQVVMQLQNDLRDLRATVVDMGSRLTKLELGHNESQHAAIRAESSKIDVRAVIPRLERLEKIYVLVDFLQLENISERILRDQVVCNCSTEDLCCDDLPVSGDSPDPRPEQQGATLDSSNDVFHLLRGMVDKTINMTCGPCYILGTTWGPCGYEPDGQSLLQTICSTRSRAASLVQTAREAWRAWEKIGHVGGLVILGSKHLLAVGTLVESTQHDHIDLVGFRGQRFSTGANLAEVRENYRSGVVLQDVGKTCTTIYGRPAMQGAIFRIIGYTF